VLYIFTESFYSLWCAIVEELLTVRQLQDLLKVDRITIYRMLDAQELPGFKVGGRWRFWRKDIEAWLAGQRPQPAAEETPALADSTLHSIQVLPLSCMSSIEAILAEACNVAAFSIAPDGAPLTELNHPCEFCTLILSTPDGRRHCEESWRSFASASIVGTSVCHAGLRYQGLAIDLNGQRVALVLAGQYLCGDEAMQRLHANLPAIATAAGLDLVDLQSRSDGIYRLSESEEQRLAHLLQQVASTFQELLQQRALLVSRLQQIAHIATGADV